jgi:hypothetical protein
MHQITRDRSKLVYDVQVRPLLRNAEEGDLRSTINILSYFCESTRLGIECEAEVVEFVAAALQKAQPYKIYKNRQRQRIVRRELKKQRDKHRKRGPSKRRLRMDIVHRFWLSEERLRAIQRSKPDCIVEFCDGVNFGENVALDLAVAVLQSIEQLCIDLLEDGKRGETIRHRLGLKGYRWWGSPEQSHIEAVQEVEGLRKTGISQAKAIQAVAKKTGLSEANVKKIMQRSRKKAAQDAIALIEAGVPEYAAIRAIAANTGHDGDDIKKIIVKTMG